MEKAVWHRVTKNIKFFENEIAAAEYIAANNELGEDGRFVLFLTAVDICSNCGGQLDTSGWCSNYCTEQWRVIECASS